MPGFNIGSSVNNAAEWVCEAPLVKSIINNPVYTSLLLTVLVAVILMALYKSTIKKLGPKRCIRTLIYIFGTMTAVIFIHHYSVTRDASASASQKGIRNMFASIQDTNVPKYGGEPAAMQPVDRVLSGQYVQPSTLVIDDVVV